MLLIAVALAAVCLCNHLELALALYWHANCVCTELMCTNSAQPNTPGTAALVPACNLL